MKKGLVCGLLLLLTGFILWRMIAGELSTPVSKVAAGVKKENFAGFSCPSCGKLFMAEVTTKKGRCPYCGFTMYLGEEEKVFGVSADESQFVPFFSPACKKLFFAYQTNEIGQCPYCGEPINLAVTSTVDLQEPPSGLLALVSAHAGTLILIALALFGISVASVYIMYENRVMLSLEPIAGSLSEMKRVELRRRQIKRRQLTLGASMNDDITISDPSLNGINYTLSFVQVGRNTHAYLRRSSNQPILVNDKPQYNANLKDRDKIQLGKVTYEVHSSRQ